ncbi:MAG TPA: NAD-glutamate dehydrogenase domain-containing protein [Chlamydiales bacterium]|nr:NAD-glutamate dehydrogenase domain-containing protein [Chlamydiales bacterium]
MQGPKYPHLLPSELQTAIAAESKEFEQAYHWLERHMPPSFLDEVDSKMRILIARNLLSFALQDRFSHIHLKQMAISCCMDGPDADLKILKNYSRFAIRYYRAFVSNISPPGEKTGNLRIALVYFRDTELDEKLSTKTKADLLEVAKENNPHLKKKEFEALLHGLTPRFLRSMNEERLKMVLEMFFRAKERDQCQYEARRNEDWQDREAPSLQLVLAWRSVPKSGFLYRLAKIIHSHQLAIQKFVATYVDPYSTENVVILSLGLHGLHGKAAWEEADIDDFLRELALTKFFEIDDPVGTTFVQTRLLTGNEGHLVRNFISFVHQVLVYADPNLYSLENIVEGFCRHPDLTVKLCKVFELKFDPDKKQEELFIKQRDEVSYLIEKLDTGQAVNDLRRKNILRQGVQFIQCTLKTNFYRHNKTSFSFRLDPSYLDDVPYNRKEKFPELPFGIFFIRGMHFIGFNIRFKDLARGGMRTVIPERREQFVQDRNNVFSEAYNLAYTQQKKNKDIPEGGAKTTILLKPADVFLAEEQVYRKELEADGLDPKIIEETIASHRKEQRQAYINSSQRCFIDSFMTLINCNEDGALRSKSVIDYWKKPEYIYLGPDENISTEMIVWIADFAVRRQYKPGHSFMSSKPLAGINHKQYGVTSYGVNVYLEEALRFLKIDPQKDLFTIKMSGGPDGDVTGNEILNLYKFYPNTAKLIALTDISGTIYDPNGLDLSVMADLFANVLPIRYFPAERLSDGGFLLDLRTKREESEYASATLLWRKIGGKLIEEWLSGSEMNLLYRNNVHQTIADVFIPGGGRPRTLSETNYSTYLDANGRPTSKAIVEGANLYLTPQARRALEKLGCIIFKDSSCNKGGVITSSFEVLAGLCMPETNFIKQKETYVKEVLEMIRMAALNEARLLLNTHKATGAFLSDISDQISERINAYKYQLLEYLEPLKLSQDTQNFLIRCLIQYCPLLLRKRYLQEILSIPDLHKKAIIACHIASRLVYSRGLGWSPALSDILPTLGGDPALFND